MSRPQNWSIMIYDMAKMVHKGIALKERQAVAISVQEHGQIVIDIWLGEIVRKLLEIQYRLRNLKAIRVDSTVRVLSQAEFLREKGTDVKPRANKLARFAEVRRRKTLLNTISQFRYA